MTRCLILAAGEGSRLRPLTQDCPKGLIPLLKKPLISHQIETLKASRIDKIAISTGYKAEKIDALGYPTFYNALYYRTNMVESLFAARSYFEKTREDLLISYGDIVYEQANLEMLLNTTGDIVVMVDFSWLDLWSIRNEDPLHDAETLKLDIDENILELGKKPKSITDIEGQYTGLIKISRDKIGDFIDFYDRLDQTVTYDGHSFEQMYMTSFLQQFINAGWLLKAAHVNHGWLEIDTVEDLRIYERLSSKGKLNRFWRPHE